MNMTKRVKWDVLVDKLRWVACGGPFQPVTHMYLIGLNPCRGRDTRTGLDYKRPKRGSVGNASPTGFICVCGPGMVAKTLLHRVDITVHHLLYRVATLGSDTPHCGASTGIYGREPIAWE